MRVATVDVGTNTALLLVADVADGRVAPVYEEERFVRLGAGVDASGRISDAALERLHAALSAYRDEARRRGASHVAAAGTSASRDARSPDLPAWVRRETGLDFEILSGDEEARWTFAGALSAFDDLAGPVTVVDVGGGSTEVVTGTPGASPSRRRSMDVGSVRLTERHFTRLPPSPEMVAAARADVERALIRAQIGPHAGTPLVGASGTATALARLAGTGDRIGRGEIAAWRDRLLGLDADAVLALAPDVMAGRADVMAAAVLILSTVVEHVEADMLRVSPRGLRHGLALRAAMR